MFILFIVLAVSPAVLAAYIASNGEDNWKKMFLKTLAWFYGITFFNMLMLYVRGWGAYDFTFISAQFLFKYMLNSMAAAVAGLILHKIWNRSKCVAKRKELCNRISVYWEQLEQTKEKVYRFWILRNTSPYYGKSAGIVVSCAVSFLLCFFAPLDLFFNNRDEFWYDLSTMLPPVAVMFLAVSVLTSLLLLLLYRLNPRIYQFVWMAEFVLFICSYVQGNYLTGNLPPLDGTQFSWEDYIAGRTESVVLWALVIMAAAALFAALPRKTFYRLAQWTVSGVCAVLAITLCMECFLTKGYESKMNAAVTTKNQFQMSKNNNFVILLLDALDAGVFQEVLEDNPEYKEAFADFTFYPDTMGGYPFTSRSVPFILSGEWYENEEPFAEYVVDVYKNSELFAQLQKNNWRMGVYEIEMPLTDPSVYRFENVSEYKIGVKSFWEFAASVCKLTGFKYAPFDLKQFCPVSMEEFNSNREDLQQEYHLFEENNQTFYTSIQKEDVTFTEENCFKYIHLEGAHVPFRYDKKVRLIEDGTYEQNVEACLTIASAYLNKLKTCGAYDNASIMIMADHGYNWDKVDGRQNPLLMVKGSNEHHNMQVSDVPVSYEDLQTIYGKLLDGEPGERILDWKEGDRRERRFLRHVYGEENHLEEYMQKGNAANTASMYPTGRVFDW